MSAKLFTNIIIFDGSGTDPFPGEVLIEGNRIKKVATGTNRIPKESGVELIDGGGACLMPGLVEAHGHISFTDVKAYRTRRNPAGRARPARRCTMPG